MAEWVDGISVATFDFQTASKNVNTFIFDVASAVDLCIRNTYLYIFVYQ